MTTKDTAGPGMHDGGGVPARVAWAIAVLDVQPGEQILEIGCGPGVAAALVAARLRNGRIVAVDRSATAVDRARRRNRAYVEEGTAEIVHASLAEMRSGAAAFDRMFAINVNVFWTGGAPELDVVRRLLRPGGTLHLFYELPAAAKAAEIRQRLASSLGRARFDIVDQATHETGRAAGLHVSAVPGNG